jgi:unspecific monooxygenase
MVAGLTHGLRRQILTMLPFGRRLVRRRDAQARVHQEVIYRTVDEIIAARIASGDTSDRDLLGLMLHEAHRDTGQRLDLENVRHQILTFLVAGHETTSGALSFALYFLATHPQVRARAQAEVDAVLGDMPGGRPSFEQIPRLRYLRRVLDEACAAPAAVRIAREWAQWEQEGRQKLLAAGTGHTVVRLRPEERAAWKRSGDAVVKAWADDMRRAGQDPDKVLGDLRQALLRHQASVP